METGPETMRRAYPEVPLDDDGRIPVTLRCMACDYNLRGLEPGGCCPECGRPVRQSLLEGDLRLADAEWLHRIQRGLHLVVFALGAVVVLVVLSFFLSALVRQIKRSAVLGDAFVVLAAVVLLAAPIAGFAGLLLATTAEPARADRPEGLSARRVTRWAALGVVALLLTGALVAVSGVLPSSWVQYGAFLAMVLVLAPLGGLLRVLARLLGRTKEAKLARKMRQHGSGTIGFVVLALAAPVVCLALPTLGGGLFQTTSVVLGFGVLLGLLCLINAFSLLRRVRRVFAAILADVEDSVGG